MAFNFSTLYTKILHSSLLEVLYEMIDFFFDGVSHKYISVSNFGAKEISKPDRYSVVFDRCSFKKL